MILNLPGIAGKEVGQMDAKRVKVTKGNIDKIRESLDFISLTQELERVHIKKHAPKPTK